MILWVFKIHLEPAINIQINKLTLPSYKVTSNIWKNKHKKLDINHDLSKSLILYSDFLFLIDLKSFTNRKRKVEHISIERGIPKLWASSVNMLCVCCALTTEGSVEETEFECKCGKVEAPQPNKGFSFINEKDDCKIIFLGEESLLKFKLESLINKFLFDSQLIIVKEGFIKWKTNVVTEVKNNPLKTNIKKFL